MLRRCDPHDSRRYSGDACRDEGGSVASNSNGGSVIMQPPGAPLTSLREPMTPDAVALRRPEGGDRTEGRNRSGVVDALRAVAALMVVVDHTSFVAVGPNLSPVA